MSLSNFERMIKLADEVFAVKSDPDQLDVNPAVMKRLQKIHPATISEFSDENGPVAWVLVIPTTNELMNRFLSCEISEKQLFDLTPFKVKYETIYLCSALCLQEYRRKGIVKKLTLDAIHAIRKNHPITSLFAWPFTAEGDAGAIKIAKLTELPLYMRENKNQH